MNQFTDLGMHVDNTLGLNAQLNILWRPSFILDLTQLKCSNASFIFCLTKDSRVDQVIRKGSNRRQIVW